MWSVTWTTPRPVGFLSGERFAADVFFSFVRGKVEHHREIADAAEFGQQFSVAGIVMTGLPERGFVQGGGDDGCDAAIER